MNTVQKFEELASALRTCWLWLDDVKDPEDPFIIQTRELLNEFHSMIEGNSDWEECSEVIEHIYDRDSEESVTKVVACVCGNCIHQDPKTRQCTKVKKQFVKITEDLSTCVDFKCRAPWVQSPNGDHRDLIKAELEEVSE